MKEILLYAHSWNRWIILVLWVAVLIRAYQGWKGKQAWNGQTARYSLLWMIAVDIQLLIGLLQYFVYSDIAKAARADMAAAMKDSVSRFWAVEHITAMVIVWVLVHLGKAMSGRENDSVKKHKKLFWYAAIAGVLMLASIPWPFRFDGFPWFRL